MKSLRLFHIIFCFLTVISIASCTDEPMELDIEGKLIGEWKRNDSSETFGYTLNFETNNTGYRIIFTKDIKADEVASSLIMFDWSTEENKLTIDGLEDIHSCSFSFDSNGHLKISDLDDYYFVRVE